MYLLKRCEKRRHNSDCASAHSDQSFRCPHEESLHPWISKMRPVKILIRLCECAGWSESSLGAHIPKYIFRRCDSNHDIRIYPVFGLTDRQTNLRKQSHPDQTPQYGVHSICHSLTLVLLNQIYTALTKSVDQDQLANWSGSALFVIKYVNSYQQPGSNNLIGW